MARPNESYCVGGIAYPRPFKIRRLGHFGFNLNDVGKGVDFYGRLLGFRVTDDLDVSKIPDFSALASKVTDPRIIFMTHGTDHHAFLIAHRSLGAIFGDDAGSKDITLNQITWQVGTLEEVVKGAEYFRAKGVEIRRVGRDMPGSNWHVYVRDPDGHTIELYYGMEQIGWDARSKPFPMYYRRFDEAPTLPQMSEAMERAEARAKEIDIFAGRAVEDVARNGTYPVGGVLLPRPFKITRLGPMKIFVRDIAASEKFYTEILGFVRTEDVTFKGQRCVFLRAGTEHHSMALIPVSLREALGLSGHTSNMSVGLELGGYDQLRNAVAHLKQAGARFIDVPAELSPGIDYCAHVQDHDGHCLQLYYYMEQIGWDGKPRPAAMRRTVAKDWPEMLEPMSDTYSDQSYLGPLG
jgi:catechol 2,3-dioxygenase-like lactoylglutathione lyase family enzyme